MNCIWDIKNGQAFKKENYLLVFYQQPFYISEINSLIMPAKNKAIDAYILKSADFAQPILNHLRELIHITCPEVEEKMKWGFPHFDYKGEMMCSMAAFKQHAVFGFWKAALLKDKQLIETAKSEVAMGHLGRITSLKDLPADKKIMAWIKEAMVLNDKGIRLSPKPTTTDKKEIIVPDYFEKLLAKNKNASAVFNAFSYSHKKEYVQWITEAKTAETRNRRMMQAIEMMTEGKSRNWKYVSK
jgi:uncharacterized protein YdeI (YjbR/CyaY-like superfamily)